MSGTVATRPLTATEKTDTRRFAGYPVTAALVSQEYGVQGDSATLDLILAALSDDQITTLRNVYLTPLRTLEADLFAVRANLDTAQAAVWYHNANELADREALFASLRRRMTFYLGIPAGAGVMPLAPAIFTV